MKPRIRVRAEYITRMAAALCGVILAALALQYWFGITEAPNRSARPPFNPERYVFILERTGCMVGCPEFVLDLQADGATSLRMNTAVTHPDEPWSSSEIVYTSLADRSQRLALIASVEHGDFWRLHSAYSQMVTDTASTRITVATPDRQWSVDVHAVRCQSQSFSRTQEDPDRGPVPDVFCALARKLDAIACQTYTQGKARPLAVNEKVFHPVACPSDP